jgi:hypothetical protein
VDERAHLFFFSQLAVEPYRLLGLPDVRGDAPVVQLPKDLRSDAESFVEALREDYHGSSVLQQLLDVGGLDARLVAGAGLVPVPLLRASREELGVFEGAILAFDVQAPPRRGELLVGNALPVPSRFTFPGSLASRLGSTYHSQDTTSRGITDNNPYEDRVSGVVALR